MRKRDPRGYFVSYPRRTCKHRGCGDPLYARGYCVLHYSRWRDGRDMNGRRQQRGRIILAIGYIGIWNNDRRGYDLEHRLVMERLLGRPLAVTEVVHHIDGNRLNNDPANLELMTRAAHNREHGTFARRNRIHPVNASGTHRWCPRCESVVVLTDWASGQGYCRPCKRERQREHYQQHLEKSRASRRAAAARYRAKKRDQE